jgi:hypothetical protein
MRGAGRAERTVRDGVAIMRRLERHAGKDCTEIRAIDVSRFLADPRCGRARRLGKRTRPGSLSADTLRPNAFCSARRFSRRSWSTCGVTRAASPRGRLAPELRMWASSASTLP